MGRFLVTNIFQPTMMGGHLERIGDREIQMSALGKAVVAPEIPVSLETNTKTTGQIAAGATEKETPGTLGRTDVMGGQDHEAPSDETEIGTATATETMFTEDRMVV